MRMTTTTTESSPELKRHVGVVGLLFASVGSIIGSGWLFGALNASMAAGPAAIISWALGGLLILLIALVYAELGTMMPLSEASSAIRTWPSVTSPASRPAG